MRGNQLERLERDVQEIRLGLVSRNEHLERWRSQERDIVGLQRQIDEQRQAFGGTYGLRDAMLEMKSKLDRVEALYYRGSDRLARPPIERQAP
jgi:hypothetical protein